ncbi:FmdE family protein [Desulfobacter postgatei]|uniref:FmdE family protein n=1 Tax=Desulfobacter postgatei TaxID=2293 RepID=UPI00259B6F18|nr:FmdE family protein [uncultured Desulfobacter sp.]
MKRFYAFILALLFFITAAPLQAQEQPLDPSLIRAMETLKVFKGDPDLLVLTNAPFVKTRSKDSLPFLARVQKLTGATVGQGNLLFFQRPQNHPLRIMLFKKTDRRAVIISAVKDEWAEETLDMAVETICNQVFWKTAKEKFASGSDLFSLVSIANAWSMDVPYDFLKAAELHNHICPGLTSGYLISHFILKHYPLSPGQHYAIIASPVWCKEDAFQVVMDLTPGKHGLVVKPLSKVQKEKISVTDPACFLLIWDDKTKSGKAVAISFDFSTLKGIYPEGTPKAATILYTAAHLSAPDKFVSVSKEFDLSEAQYNAMKDAGSNPYEIAGLTSD